MGLWPRMPRQGENRMPTYISLCRWTTQGATTIKESPKRRDAAKKVFSDAGIKVLSFYMTTGTHDMVIITDAPDDQAPANASRATTSKGSIPTQTSRAFTEDEE